MIYIFLISLISAIYSQDVYGCTVPDACNYNPDATIDDGSCYWEETYYYDYDGDGWPSGDSYMYCPGDQPLNYIPLGGEIDCCEWIYNPIQDPTHYDGCPACYSGWYYSDMLDLQQLPIEFPDSTQYINLQGSIPSLYYGDLIAIVDFNAIIYDDECNATIGELILGHSSWWSGSTIGITVPKAVDNCGAGGGYQSGFVVGNDIGVRIYHPSGGVFDASVEYSLGDGQFSVQDTATISHLYGFNFCPDCIEQYSGISGDLNNSWDVDILDLVRMIIFIMNEQNCNCGDLNDDELLDILDVIVLVEVIMSID